MINDSGSPLGASGAMPQPKAVSNGSDPSPFVNHEPSTMNYEPLTMNHQRSFLPLQPPLHNDTLRSGTLAEDPAVAVDKLARGAVRVTMAGDICPALFAHGCQLPSGAPRGGIQRIPPVPPGVTPGAGAEGAKKGTTSAFPRLVARK